MLRISWTDGIHELLEILTCRVRVLSLSHIRSLAAQLFDAGTHLPNLVKSLVDADLLHGDVWDTPVCSIGNRPLFEWRPGCAAPDCYELERVVQNRWPEASEPIPVVAATHFAARVFGSSGGGLPPVHHRGHDLLLADVYVQYRLRRPDLAEVWCGEDSVALAERGVKNPDAFLVNQRGSVVRVIESAGRYSQRQLELFHEHCRIAGLPYELW